MNNRSNPLYFVWNSIRNRCENSESRDYPKYGEKGVRLYEEWREDPSAFFSYVEEHLGERPSPSHSLDRFPDKEGNYEPGNIRWATPREQNLNRRPFKHYIKPEVPTGRSGIRWVRERGKSFVGFFRSKGKFYQVGSFPTAEEAFAAVVERRLELGLPIPE